MTTIRSAREDEVPLLAAIGLAAWEGAVTGVAELAADQGAMRRVAQLAFLSFARSFWHRIRVAEQEGLAIGWAACEREDGTITDLWVRPDLQRRRIGTQLMDSLEREMRAGGIEIAEAATHAANAGAIGFFSGRGYRIAWLSTRYAARLDREVEQVGLRKTLMVTNEADEGIYGRC